MLDTQRRLTLEALRGLEAGAVLDVGGGHGQVAPDLARAGHRVEILASSPRAISVAMQAHVDSGLVSFKTGDLGDPPFEPRSFDVVLSYRLLAHARDLPRLVTGLTRCARRAVIVDYATTRSFNAFADLFFSAKKRVEQNTRPFAVMRDHDVAALFRRNGFVLRVRKPQFFWPMALHRALRAPGMSRGLEAVSRDLGLQARFGSPVIARFDRG